MKLPFGDKAKHLIRGGLPAGRQVLHFAAVPGLMLWLASLGWAREGEPVGAIWGLAAAALATSAGVYRFWRGDERKLTLAARLIFGVSFALLLLLSANLHFAVGLAVAYGIVMLKLLNPRELEHWRPIASGVLQFVSLWAIFLAAAVWQWPSVLILIFTWVSAYVTACWYIDVHEERAGRLLAGTWALIASQTAWVFSIWLVNYILVGGRLIVPQAALVITALGYVFSGIFASHKKSQLGRWRLAEYLLIGLLLILIVAVGTRWTATI